MEIVLLSAGFGRRMGSDGKLHLPDKHLLQVGSELLINRQLRLLNGFGIRNIKVVAGLNKDEFIKSITYPVEYMETTTNHNNNLYEVADVCRVTTEKNVLLIILGDTIFSSFALKEMIDTNKSDIILFGSGDYKELGLKREDVWWYRDKEIFALKLFGSYIKRGHTIFGSMKYKYYGLKNIQYQLKLPIHYLKECFDIDQQSDYEYCKKLFG